MECGIPQDMDRKTKLVFPHSEILGFMILNLVRKENKMQILPYFTLVNAYLPILIVIDILECFAGSTLHNKGSND